MKLFYHFLFFVGTSLILVACANMFASDPQSQSQNDEFTSPKTGAKRVTEDTTVSIGKTNPFVLAGLKDNIALLPGSVLQLQKNSAFNKASYLHQFQVAMNRLGSPKSSNKFS